MERNLKIMKYYLSFSLPFMLGPILHIYYESRGLNVSDYYILFSVGLISIFVFEIPTGVIADRVGYKQSLIMGSITLVFSMCGMIFANNVWHFIICEVLFGIGMSFISGADAGLVYDTLVALKRENEYSDIYGKSRQYIFVVAGVGSLLSSMLYKINDQLPLIINATFISTTVIAAFLLTEPERKKQTQKINYKKQLYIVKNHVFKTKRIWAVILLSSTIFIFYRPSINLYRPYFKAVNLDVFYYGMIFLGLNIIAQLSSKHTKLYLRWTNKHPLLGLVVLLVITHLCLSVPIVYIGLLGMGINQIVRALYKPVVTTYVNDLTPSNIRATTLSFVSLLNNIAAGIGALIISTFANDYEIFQFVLILAISMSFMTIIIYSFIYKRYSLK